MSFRAARASASGSMVGSPAAARRLRQPGSMVSFSGRSQAARASASRSDGHLRPCCAAPASASAALGLDDLHAPLSSSSKLDGTALEQHVPVGRRLTFFCSADHPMRCSLRGRCTARCRESRRRRRTEPRTPRRSRCGSAASRGARSWLRSVSVTHCSRRLPLSTRSAIVEQSFPRVSSGSSTQRAAAQFPDTDTPRIPPIHGTGRNPR